jgi:predicted O-methyltransferase YrrM
MNPETWSAVDRYVDETFALTDPVLAAAVAESEAAGLPAIQVSAPQGRLLNLLLRAMGARRVLEIGTLGGYSAIWMARALPADGRLVSLELDAKHAEVARRNLARAGLERIAEVRLGRALDSLTALAAERGPAFDLAFIDADKPTMPEYLEWSVKLVRAGGLIIADNVVRDGHVIDAASGDPSVQGVRRMHEAIAANPRLTATAIQTVGSKGYDGFTLIRVGEA